MKILEQISIDRSGCSGFDCNQLKYRVHVLSRILGGERFIEGNTDDHTGERAKKNGTFCRVRRCGGQILPREPMCQ